MKNKKNGTIANRLNLFIVITPFFIMGNLIFVCPACLSGLLPRKSNVTYTIRIAVAFYDCHIK